MAVVSTLFVAEPEGDDGGVDAGLEQPHRGGVAQHVGVTRLSCSGRAARGGGGDVFGEAVLDGVAAEWSAVPGGEQRVAGLAGRSVSHGRSTATVAVVSGVMRFLRPLPWQRTWAPVPRWTSPQVSPVSSATRSPVWTATSEQRLVASPGPGVGSGAARRASISAAVRYGDDRAVEPFRWDGEHAPDGGGVFGVAQRGVVGTVTGSRRGGCCGCARCCAGRVRGDRGRRRSSRRRGRRCRGRRVACRCGRRRSRAAAAGVAVGGDGVRRWPDVHGSAGR